MDLHIDDFCKRLELNGHADEVNHRWCNNQSQMGSTSFPKVNHGFRLEGNKFYAKKIYHMAVIFYNKALCCAGPEEIGILYGNRSAVAFETGRYPQCLINIQFARQHNLPIQISSRLNEREKKCLELMSKKKTSISNPENLMNLSYGPNIVPK